eukprot:3926801-Lingulodinium_polyedra.AAC.1
MGAAFGMDEATTATRALMSDAAGRTALPRSRILLSSLPSAPGPAMRSRDGPWRCGWAMHRESHPAPMVRARGQDGRQPFGP